MEARWKKRVVQNVTQLFLLLHLQSLLCTIIDNPHVISHRHLTEGTGASEARLSLQRSIGIVGVVVFNPQAPKGHCLPSLGQEGTKLEMYVAIRLHI